MRESIGLRRLIRFFEQYLDLNTTDKKFETSVFQIELPLSIDMRLRNLEDDVDNRKQNPSLRQSMPQTDNENTLARNNFKHRVVEPQRNEANDQTSKVELDRPIRQPVGDIARITLDWNPQGTRKRLRPKATCKRTVVNEASEDEKE